MTGSGFGTFRDLYPKYRHFTGDLIVQHAHNDYLELLAEGGLLSVLLVLSVFMVFFYKSFRAFRKRRDPFSIYLFIGSLAGMISIFIHSLIDFNLHIGANGLYVFFLMGLNISAANTRISCQKQDTHLKTIQLPRPIITGLLVVIFILFMVAVNIAGLVSELNYASIRDVRLNQNLSETATSKIHQRALRACRLDPLEPKYRFAAANIEAFLLNEDLAQRQYLAALRLNPTRGEYLQQLALRMSDRGNFDVADKLFQASIGYHSSDPGTYFAYAVWLLTQGRKASALENLNLAIALDHRKIENGLTLMVIHGLSASEMQKAIPEKVKPQLHFADFLHQTGKTEMADGVYRRALKFVKNEATANVSHFNKVYLYYLNNDRIDDAIEILNQAMKYFPTDPHLRLKAAALYERKGIIHHAIEEYKRVLVIDPENRHAKRKLRKIMSQ